MYIEPNTTIKILQNVPLDNSYSHTIYFDSASAQANYFSGLTKYNLTRQSYQRVERGVARVQLRAEQLYNCNYMMFQNASFEPTRWFYAFITSVEYVNNETSNITFEIDVMQTWFFDVTLKDSFIDREHSETDNFGDNITPEPIVFGDYFLGQPISTHLFDTYDIVVVSPYVYAVNQVTNPWNKNLKVKTVDDNPSILCHMALKEGPTEVSSVTFVEKAMSEFPTESDIVTMYLCPSQFITYPEATPNCVLINTNLTGREVNYGSSRPTQLSHGYTPKNKKLLTFPYNKFVVDTGDGNLYDYMYEYFGSESGLKFEVNGYRGINLSFKSVPFNYKGQGRNYSEGCLLTDFPNVGYTIDSFKTWVAQNKTRLAVQGVGHAIGVGSGLGEVMAGASMLTPKTQVLSSKGAKRIAKGYEKIGKVGVMGAIGTIAMGIDKASISNHPTSASTDGSMEIHFGRKDFTGIQYSINPNDSRIIDDFFTMYGYSTQTIKVPNRNVRPHWTYTKTVGCNLIGNAPSDDIATIVNIYDNGITFWKNGNEVGNYSLDNSPS